MSCEQVMNELYMSSEWDKHELVWTYTSCEWVMNELDMSCEQDKYELFW
jgi:hypothetical protein